jgi:hypothetical protein
LATQLQIKDQGICIYNLRHIQPEDAAGSTRPFDAAAAAGYCHLQSAGHSVHTHLLRRDAQQQLHLLTLLLLLLLANATPNSFQMQKGMHRAIIINMSAHLLHLVC